MYHAFGVNASIDYYLSILLARPKPLEPLWMYLCICPIFESVGGCGDLKYVFIHKYHYWGDKGGIVPILGIHTMFICCTLLNNPFK